MDKSTEATQEPSVKHWFGVLFPGIFFVPLFWFGWFSVLWFLFFLIWIYYFLRFLSLSLPSGFAYLSKKPMPYPKQKVLRVLLPSIIIPSAFLLSRQSCFTAYAFAVDVGQDIQDRISLGGTCPQHLEGWDVSPFQSNKSTTYYGKFGAKYKVTYTVDTEEQTFIILVPHCVEYSFVVNGGKDVELKSTFNGVAEVPLDHFKKFRLFKE
jgi:hypothetical protein